LTDYAHYNVVGAATPTKVIAPVAVVGGEEGGRAAIQVHDELAQDPKNPPGDSSTHVLLGQAEPGHDMFAADGEDVKSRPVDPPKEEEEQSKVVSAMDAAKKQVEPKVKQPAVKQEEQKKESVAGGIPEPHVEDDMDNGTTVTTSVQSAESVVPDSGEKAEPTSEVLQEQGPVVEEVAEAERVRDELFNEEPSTETASK